MVLERYRDGFQGFLTPLARGALAVGLTADGVTLLSLAVAIAAGIAYALGSASAPWLLVLGGSLAGANAFLDGIDGRMARLSGSAGRRGDYLDHVVDRYADVALLVGLALSAAGHPVLGLFALVGTLLTSYMGTQSQALGLGRNYAGLLGRAERTILVAAVPGLEAIRILLGLPWPLAWNPIWIMLAYVAVAGNITAVQRFWSGWRELAGE